MGTSHLLKFFIMLFILYLQLLDLAIDAAAPAGGCSRTQSPPPPVAFLKLQGVRSFVIPRFRAQVAGKSLLAYIPDMTAQDRWGGCSDRGGGRL